MRHPDICVDASVSALDDDSTLTDLERMGVRSCAPTIDRAALTVCTAQLREPDRHAGPYTFEQLYGGSQYGIPPYADPRGVPTALPAPFGYPSFDVAPPVSQQHPFGAASPFGTFPSANTSQPLSNPRSNNFPKEMGGTASGRPFEDSPFASGVYGGEAHAPAWQKSVGGGEDRRRQRTPSAGGGGLADSLDIVAGSKERHGEASGEGMKGVNGTGHNTLKARPSLDFHMAHSRSPKAPPKVNGTGVGSSSTTTERAGFLSIPPYRGPSSSSTTTTAHAPAVNGASDLPPIPAASTASAAPPPQPQTTPLLGTMPLKAAPTLFGGSPAEGAGAFAHFGSGIEAGTR